MARVPLWVWAAAITTAGAVTRLPWLAMSGDRGSYPDTGTYLVVMHNLLAGHGLDTGAYRLPGYPLFLTPFSWLPGPTVDAATIAQQAIGLAAIAAIVLMIGPRLGRLEACVAAAIVALSPLIAVTEHSVLPDFLFGVLVLVGAVLLGDFAGRPGSRRLALSVGLTLGLAATIKPNGQALVLAIPLTLLVATRSWRRSLVPSLLAMGVMVAIMVPWTVHNWVVNGHPVYSIQGGGALYLRVYDQDRTPFPDTAYGRLAREVDERHASEYSPGEVTGGYSYFDRELRHQGKSAYESAKIMLDLSLQGIREHPKVYAKGTWRNIKAYGTYAREFGSPRVIAGEQFSRGDPPPGVEVARAAWRLGDGLAAILWIVSLHGLAVLTLPFLGPPARRRAATAYLTVAGILIVTGSMTNYVEARFAAQTAPLVWLLWAAAGVSVVRALAGLRRLRASARSGPDV